MLLEHGWLVDIGDTDRVGTKYLELNFSAQARAAEAEAAQAVTPAPAEAADEEEAHSEERVIEPEQPQPERMRFGNGKAEMIDGWFEDASGRTEMLRAGEPCTFCVRARFHEQVENPLLGMSIYNAIDDCVLGFNNRQLGPAGVFEPGEELVFRVEFENILVPGRYHVSPAIAHDGGGFHWIDFRKRWVSVIVTGTGGLTGALVEMPFDMSLQRPSAPAARPVRSA
jgi:hypothetical protein